MARSTTSIRWVSRWTRAFLSLLIVKLLKSSLSILECRQGNTTFFIHVTPPGATMKISNKSSTIQDYIKLHHLEEVFDLKVIELLQLHYFDANEPIIDEATDVKYLYLVLEGESRVSPATQEGKIGFLEFIYPMDVIGDLEYFSGGTLITITLSLYPPLVLFLAIPVLLIEKHFNHNINFYSSSVRIWPVK